NACGSCHADRDAGWAAAAIEKTYGPGRKGFQTFVDALHAGRIGEPGAREKLSALVRDAAAPGIARATAVAALEGFPGRTALDARPEAHLDLGIVYADRGDATRAEAEYRAAIRLQPDFVPAYANLADLYRALGREADAASALADGLKAVPDDPSLVHALGLKRVREKRVADA